ncbi:MAG: hypothetical protein U5R06_05990 [candidate division KSB1 bacterium]|nr:hypothetical protein [candidate division KSB1 bacterium]
MLSSPLKYLIYSLFFCIASGAFSNTDSPYISVSFPAENDTLYPGPSDSVFIIGTVQPKDAKVSINGAPVEPIENGSFLAFVPFAYDSFAFVCRAVLPQDTTRIVRNVFIQQPWQAYPDDSLWFDSTFTLPGSDYKTISGKSLLLQCRATPGQRVYAQLTPLDKRIQLFEGVHPETAYWGEMALGSGAVIPNTPRNLYTASLTLSDFLFHKDSLDINYV